MIYSFLRTVIVLPLVLIMAILDPIIISRRKKYISKKAFCSYKDSDCDLSNATFDVIILGSNLSALATAAFQSRCGKVVFSILL